MSGGSVLTLHCDGADAREGCPDNSWAVNDYAIGTYKVDGVQISQDQPHPGWTKADNGDDLCPDCTCDYQSEATDE